MPITEERLNALAAILAPSLEKLTPQSGVNEIKEAVIEVLKKHKQECSELCPTDLCRVLALANKNLARITMTTVKKYAVVAELSLLNMGRGGSAKPGELRQKGKEAVKLLEQGLSWHELQEKLYGESANGRENLRQVLVTISKREELTAKTREQATLMLKQKPIKQKLEVVS